MIAIVPTSPTFTRFCEDVLRELSHSLGIPYQIAISDPMLRDPAIRALVYRWNILPAQGGLSVGGRDCLGHGFNRAIRSF